MRTALFLLAQIAEFPQITPPTMNGFHSQEATMGAVRVLANRRGAGTPSSNFLHALEQDQTTF